MSTDDVITVAPEPVVLQRDDAAVDKRPNCCLRLVSGMAKDCVNDVTDRRNCEHCLCSCLYFFFCHALNSVILRVCFCGFLCSLGKQPESLETETCTQRITCFILKLLSNLWTSLLIFLIAWLLILRPSAVKPMLGASIVHEFDLVAAGAGSPTALELRFNMTPSLLSKSTHAFYTTRFNHLAAAVFYAGEKLGPVDDDLPPIKQKPLRSAVLDVVVAGRVRNASAAVVKKFAEEKVQGRFEVKLTIRTTLTYKFWPYKEDYFYIYDCPLEVPVPVPRGGEPVLTSPSSCLSVEV